MSITVDEAGRRYNTEAGDDVFDIQTGDVRLNLKYWWLDGADTINFGSDISGTVEIDDFEVGEDTLQFQNGRTVSTEQEFVHLILDVLTDVGPNSTADVDGDDLVLSVSQGNPNIFQIELDDVADDLDIEIEKFGEENDIVRTGNDDLEFYVLGDNDFNTVKVDRWDFGTKYFTDYDLNNNDTVNFDRLELRMNKSFFDTDLVGFEVERGVAKIDNAHDFLDLMLYVENEKGGNNNVTIDESEGEVEIVLDAFENGGKDVRLVFGGDVLEELSEQDAFNIDDF